MFSFLLILVILIGIVSFGVNIYQFCKCDFEPPYKAEIVHGAGIVFPPAAMVTVWVPVGK